MEDALQEIHFQLSRALLLNKETDEGELPHQILNRLLANVNRVTPAMEDGLHSIYLQLSRGPQTEEGERVQQILSRLLGFNIPQAHIPSGGIHVEIVGDRLARSSEGAEQPIQLRISRDVGPEEAERLRQIVNALTGYQGKRRLCLNSRT